nr:5'-methylthioadenosine/S-adenosylhomocysteine nucleosidase [Actinoplanes toevensis]
MLRTHQRPEEDEPVNSDHPIVILTALDLEYDAVRRHLADPRLHRHNAGTRFEVGRLADGTPIALGLVGKGNHPAAVLAERAIHEFTPTAVLFVGVAGALWPAIGLGTVVVATHVYAYHGGTSEDDGFKARPRVWEIAHQADQVARHVKRTGDWARDLPDGVRPDVTFGPIAAGEVVQDSAFSAHAAWVRDTYNDAVAIEMEGAGIAQAAHLNLALPAVIVRGISDRADGSKSTTDGQNWQPAAARNAAAFAVALAGELSREVRTNSHRGETMQERITNFAGGHARVGVQAGQIHGDVTVGQHRRSAVLSLEDQVEEFRQELRDLHGQGLIDSATLGAVRAELAVVVDSPPTESLLALKKIHGLVLDLPELTALVTAMLALVRERS